jgi:hypothetical protein
MNLASWGRRLGSYSNEICAAVESLWPGAQAHAEKETAVKRLKWLGGSRATKSDKVKKARQQTDQRMNAQKEQLGETRRKTRRWRIAGPSERFYTDNCREQAERLFG